MSQENLTDLEEKSVWLDDAGIVARGNRLVGAVAGAERALDQATYQLAQFCQQEGCEEIAVPFVERLLGYSENPQVRAWNLLCLGQLQEGLGEFNQAARNYAEGRQLRWTDPYVGYLLANNMGFCLNQLGEHDLAETRCREAIEITPERYNAHKNLGVALEGQGRLAEAVLAYVEATVNGPHDPRALAHLERLVAEHPALYDEMPDLADLVAQCRGAVEEAGHPMQ